MQSVDDIKKSIAALPLGERMQLFDLIEKTVEADCRKLADRQLLEDIMVVKTRLARFKASGSADSWDDAIDRIFSAS
jgi:hypothetical protein